VPEPFKRTVGWVPPAYYQHDALNLVEHLAQCSEPAEEVEQYVAV